MSGDLEVSGGGLYSRVRAILDSAQTSVARTVNSTQVTVNWLVGQQIIEEQQRGRARAGYGEALLQTLSEQLAREFGRGWSVRNLEFCRSFYLGYPLLLDAQKSNAVRSISATETSHTTEQSAEGTPDSPGPERWKPGRLHHNLSWTHYRILLRVTRTEARSFYEIEAVRNNWSARELERQIGSLLFDRLARSRDKNGVMRLATEGQEIARPSDVFKDPTVIEFLGLPESPRLVESELEAALTSNLQAFLLELGKGFAYIARQQRLTLDGDHFYVDLVFYHAILKCYVLVDLKVGRLTHADLGQLQLYVNYYDQERLTPGDNPTLGLILCMDKNDAVVRYTLGPTMSKRIFASRYQFYLPTEAELAAEIRRELRQLSPSPSARRRRRRRQSTNETGV